MRWTHLLAALTVSGCAPPPVAIDAIAEGYVRVSLQLAQHDPSLVEDWRGPDSWRPGPREPGDHPPGDRRQPWPCPRSRAAVGAGGPAPIPVGTTASIALRGAAAAGG